MASVKPGDTISYKREGTPYEGVVTDIRDNSVIVEYGFSKQTNQPLKTVVNHKNYKIMKSK